MEPRINNLLVDRCDSNGSLNDDGSYVHLTFDWMSDEAVTSIEFRYKSESDTNWTISNISASGTEGSVDKIYSDIDPEKKYTYAITVQTADSENIRPGIIPSAFYISDQKTGGRGASFGRTAELEGVLDIEFKTRNAGGILQPFLPYGTDLNEVMIPNTYAGGHVGPEKYKNCPAPNGTFLLKVETSGDEDEIMQTFFWCHKTTPKTFVRFYYNGEWGDWIRTDNTEDVLYENTSGTDGNVTLSASAAGFRYLDIYYTDNNGRGGGHARVFNPNGKYVHLGLQETGESTIFLRQTVYTISGTTITRGLCSIVRITAEKTAAPTWGTNYIKIVKVVGQV